MQHRFDVFSVADIKRLAFVHTDDSLGDNTLLVCLNLRLFPH